MASVIVRMWDGFEVTTASWRRTAPSTTVASTMSSCAERAANAPTDLACSSVNGSVVAARMKCPHPSVVAISSDQRSGVVGDPVHQALLREGCRRSMALARAGPSAISSREGAVLAFPHGDTLAAGIETEAMGGGVGDPRADRRAFGGGGLVDGIGQVGGK